jgi:outer membrane biosynthesis protein TonB
MAKQVVPALVGAALGVMFTTAIALSVRPKHPPACEACPACPQVSPAPAPPPASADAGVDGGGRAEADLDGGPDLGDLSCTLDEVGCLLADRPPPCCAMYGNRHIQPAPTSLSADQIRAVVIGLRARISRCAEESDQHGPVKAQVRVAPDGRVANVVIRTAPDDALAQCVAAIMRSARFPTSDTGVSFTYPFVF